MPLAGRRIGFLLLVFILSAGACSNDSGSGGNDSGSSGSGDLLGVAPSCPISQEQVLSPELATMVPNGLDASLCDFGVFGWESFLNLVGPASDANPDSDPSSGRRRFLVESDYRQYVGPVADSCAEVGGFGKNVFSTRFVATKLPGVSPEAGAGTIYSVEGDSLTGDNVIVYNIRFGADLCDAPGPDLPSNLVEIKTAWRFLPDGADRSRYYWQALDLPNGEEIILGMVGFHLAQVTDYHPEMIWTSFEHVDNSPDCVETATSPPEPSAGWTMTMDDCASCLRSSSDADCTNECSSLNQTRPPNAQGIYPLNADPTNVCRVYPQGTKEGDLDADENRSNIDSLNAQVMGEGGILASLPASDPQSVWQNYQMIGGIWFNTASDTTPPTFVLPASGSNTGAQRGSLQLANSVMETTFQGGPVAKVPSAPNAMLNCFVCHQTSDYSQTLDVGGLSHISDHVHGSNPN
ncbi:MAG: hypothetical protein CL917_11635 [Deltaproteobacteria bacterium]|nr:hypothetical protein [Deltaproteobacteria bacterium]